MLNNVFFQETHMWINMKIKRTFNDENCIYTGITMFKNKCMKCIYMCSSQNILTRVHDTQ